MRARVVRLVTLAVVLALVPAAGWTTADADAPSILASDARHRQVARMVTRFVERQHYSRMRVDDSLSATVLDNYLKSLDPGKQYFLEADIKYFSRYRNRLDDVLREGDLEPVFQPGLGHEPAKDTVRQRAPANVAQTDEHDSDFVGGVCVRRHQKDAG